MAANLILLTGAPDIDNLDWNETNLTSSFETPIRRYLGEDIPHKSTATTTQSSLALPKWRALSLPVTAAQAPGRRGQQLVSLQDAPGLDNTRELEHLNYLEYSLAILQNLDSSQIEVPDGTFFVDGTTTFTSGSFGATFDTDQSLLRSNDSLSTHSSDKPEQQIVNFTGPYTDLKQIPTARHLRSIHPQTMTVNVVASVITVQPARTVRLRKRLGEMDVIEVLFGDETRAGFSVSFWVPPSTTTENGFRKILAQLRPGDILLLTHIALQDYQNTVTGQSLSRRITRNTTTVTVLSDSVTGLAAPVAAKVQRVRDWARNFVGSKTTNKRAASPGANERTSRARLELPPETQTQPG